MNTIIKVYLFGDVFIIGFIMSL